MEDVLFVTERQQSRTEVATLFRSIAEKLDDGEPITLTAGDDAVTLDVPSHPTFEVKVEREVEGRGTELSVEFELEWDENGANEGLSID